MYSNAQPTPSMVDLGAAIVTAVLAVLKNPEEAEAVLNSRMQSVALTDEEAKKAEEARALLEKAEAHREWLAAETEALNAKATMVTAGAAKLKEAQDIHTTNVERLAESVKLHEADMIEHDKKVKQFEALKKAFSNEYKELVDAQEENRKWEKDLTRREQALAGAAAAISGKAA